MPVRLDHVAQFSLRESVRSFEIDIHDSHLGRFGNLEGHRGPACPLIGIGFGFHFGLRITRLLVHLFYFLGIGVDLARIHRLADFGADLLLQLGRPELFVAHKNDVRDLELAFQQINQSHPFERALLSHADVLKKAGGIKILDILVDGVAVVRLALFDMNVRPNQPFAHRRRPHIGDNDFSDQRLAARLFDGRKGYEKKEYEQR